jgi:hypothetical protein
MQNKDITTTSFATGFISSNEQTTTAAVTVISLETADITVNSNALAILIEGAIHYQVGPTKPIEDMFNVLLKVNRALLSSKTGIITFNAKSRDMDYLRHFTECYLTNQENVKEKTPDLFETDMYITGKLLLLDIRQWQVGQIIFKEVIS